MNTKPVCSLLLACVLVGCASSVQWVQAGKTEAETERDYKECRKQTEQQHGQNVASPHFTADLNQCMKSKGYQPKD